MLALYPNRRAANKLAHPEHSINPYPETEPGWLPPKDIHMTLIYAGDIHDPDLIDDLTDEAVKITRFIKEPITTNVTGSLTFPPDHSGTHPLCRSVQLTPALRKLLYFLDIQRFSASEHPGFVPHMTIGYTKRQVSLAPNVSVPVRFDAVTLCIGNLKHTFRFQEG